MLGAMIARRDDGSKGLGANGMEESSSFTAREGANLLSRLTPTQTGSIFGGGNYR